MFIYSLVIRKDIANVSRQLKICITDIQKLPSTVSLTDDWEMAVVYL